MLILQGICPDRQRRDRLWPLASFELKNQTAAQMSEWLNSPGLKEPT